MEEILASIRRIISEDGEPETGEAVETSADDDFQGFDVVSDDDASVSLDDFSVEEPVEAEASDEDDDGHLLSVDDLLGDDVDFSEIDELSDLEIVTEAAPVEDTPAETITVADTIDTGFAPDIEPDASEIPDDLAQTMEAVMATPAVEDQPAYHDEVATPETVATAPISTAGTGDALEGLVRELMAPMIKQWIDQNLPGLVEQRVEQEIQQIANKVVAALREQ